MARTTYGFSTLRARSYVFRLPLFTRMMLAAIVLFELIGLQSAWNVRNWGALIPDQMNFATRKLALNVFHIAATTEDTMKLEANIVFLCFSIPNEHFPSDTRQLNTRAHEYLRPDAIAGEI